MKTKIEKISDLNRKMVVTLPINDFNIKVKSALGKVAKDIKMDGFRAGKVPMSVVEEKFGISIRQEEANKIVNETLYKAFMQEKTSPAATPVLKNVDFEGSDFTYEIHFDVFPEFKMKKISSLKLEKIISNVEDKDIEAGLLRLQEGVATYKEVETKAVDRNKLTIDYVGTIKGEAFNGGTAKEQSLVLGSQSMIDGFEKGLLGAKKGEEVTLKLKFPSKYHAKELAGKKVEFAVTVTKVEEAILPELNDDFAKQYNEENIDALKKNMREHMEKENKNGVTYRNKENAFMALLEANKFDVPQSSIDEEAGNLLKDTEARMKQEQMKVPDSGLDQSLFNDEAEKRIKFGLLSAKVVDDNKLTVTTEQINKHIEDLAKEYPEEQAKQMIDWYHKDKSRLDSIRSLVLEKEIENFIFANAKVKEVKQTFEEVAKYGR
jgi:trigger factor